MNISHINLLFNRADYYSIEIKNFDIDVFLESDLFLSFSFGHLKKMHCQLYCIVRIPFHMTTISMQTIFMEFFQ